MDDIVKIILFGEEYRFRPDKEVENSQKIAENLQHYLNQAEEQFKAASSDKNRIAVLLLAAMNISKDLYEIKSGYSKLEGDVSERISSLVDKIDIGINKTVKKKS